MPAHLASSEGRELLILTQYFGNKTMARKKIALIGGGQIGGILALLIAEHELGDAVIFEVPDRESAAQGKALDILEGTPLLEADTRLSGTSNYDDVAGADVVVVTAGLPRKPGMSREDLLATNVAIIKDVATNIAKVCPDAFCVIVTNPLDAMVYTFQKVTGFAPSKVVGMAGVLDSARFRTFVAHGLNVSVQDVQGIVLGGHGDTMVPIVRTCTVGGVPLTELMSQDKIDAIVTRTRKAGGEIVGLLGNGSAFVSPATSVFEMIESYLKDKKRVLAAAAHLVGEYGIKGYYMGVPVVIGSDGAEKVLEIQLDASEKEALDTSLNAVKKAVDEVKL
jgi:malate dehydrogenase